MGSILGTVLILGAVAALFLAVIVILLLQIRQRRPGYMWLAALLGSGLAWLIVVAARISIPYQIVLVPWSPDLLSADSAQDVFNLPGLLFSNSPTLLLDTVSWAYALALSSLALSIFLTAVSRLPGANWRAWSGTLVLAGLGLLAVMAGNPLTVLLTWTALDLAELVIWLTQLRQGGALRRMILSFSIRISGLIILSGVIVATAATSQEGLSFDNIMAEFSPLLILAAGLRLGVLPLQAPFLADTPLRQGLGTILRLSPLTASLVFLTRTAVMGVPQQWLSLFMIAATVSAVFSAISWASAQDSLSGRPFWMLLTASFAVIAAMLRQPAACLAWGVTSSFVGGVIFLSSVRHRILMPMLGVAVLGVTMLPFTPTWAGANIYMALLEGLPLGLAALIGLALVLSQALLLLGALRHALVLSDEPAQYERWIWLIYPLGLSLLLLSFYAFGWLNQPILSELVVWDWLAGGLVCAVVLGLWFLGRRYPARFVGVNKTVDRSSSLWGRFLSLQWGYPLLQRLFYLIQRLIGLLSTNLEAEGGLLWALLFLLMFFSLVFQLGAFQ
jgi:hypothetical protein